MQFYQLAIGAKFFAHGQSFRKTAISMATDGKIGHVFMAETEVEPDGEPMLLPPEEAAKWKPSEVRLGLDTFIALMYSVRSIRSDLSNDGSTKRLSESALVSSASSDADGCG